MNYVYISDDKLDRMSQKVLTNLESIDDDADTKDILLVKIHELEEAKTSFGADLIGNDIPFLIVFKGKEPIKFSGDLADANAVLDWMQNPGPATKKKPVAMSMKKPTQAPEKPAAPVKKPKAPEAKPAAPAPANKPQSAEAKPAQSQSSKKKRVSTPAEKKVPDPTPEPEPEDEEEQNDAINDELVDTVGENTNVVVFFYDTMDKVATKIVSELHRIEQGSFQGKGIIFLNVEAKEVHDIEIGSVPSIVYFKNSQPMIYKDNLMNQEAITAFIQAEFDSNQDVIEDLSAGQIENELDSEKFVVIYACK